MFKYQTRGRWEGWDDDDEDDDGSDEMMEWRRVNKQQARARPDALLLRDG